MAQRSNRLLYNVDRTSVTPSQANGRSLSASRKSPFAGRTQPKRPFSIPMWSRKQACECGAPILAADKGLASSHAHFLPICQCTPQMAAPRRNVFSFILPVTLPRASLWCCTGGQDWSSLWVRWGTAPALTVEQATVSYSCRILLKSWQS